MLELAAVDAGYGTFQALFSVSLDFTLSGPTPCYRQLSRPPEQK